ncbi:MAG: acyltransferase [Alistipes sp.]
MSQNPEGWSGKSRGGYTGYIIFIFLIRRVGLWAAYILLGFVVIYFIPCAPKATAAIWDFYRRTLHKGRITSVICLVRHYYLFGQTLIDRVAVENGLGKRFRFEFEDYEQTLQLFEQGQGLVMISAHFGTPSIGAEFFGKYAQRINLVMYDAEHRRVKEALDRFGQRMVVQVIPVGDDPLASILDIKAALDRNECVSFMGDRFLDGHRTFESDFLGRPARFPQGPFLIAERMQIPVIFYFATRERRRTYRFRFFTVKPVTSGRRDGTRCFKAFVPLLEEEVRRKNTQWFNFYKFWN